MKIYLTIGLLTLFTISISSCKQKEGCTDQKALNFDSGAEKEDNSLCRFTTATFYASSNTYEGVEVTEIILTLGQTGDTIGIITTFNQPVPENCSTTGTAQYDFKSGNSQVWFAQYRLATGGVVTKQDDFEPSSDKECLVIDVLQ